MNIGQIEAEINKLKFKRDIATAGSETIEEIRRISAPFDAEITRLDDIINGWISEATAQLKKELESPQMAAALAETKK